MSLTNRYLQYLITVFFTLFVLSLSSCAQQFSGDVRWLIDVLHLSPGSVVADIGAGDGDHTLAIARHIGGQGQIYSTELGAESVQELRGKIQEAEASNVTVLEGHPMRTNLPESCCDAIYLRRVYHHITDPPAFNASILQSLKPGGRLAIIDFVPRGDEAEPGGRASGRQHGVTNETVVEELTQAGFSLISSKQEGRDIYVVVEKPEAK